ncbi:hypothetical protein MOQ72_33375 [Saccharopolyspora sp. K220]|uniref:beta-ketoacyl synthase N-terminal-like domain-containing protein n=1 Tax=Saccharopolyspora soli TaxID=2926618 RepID=UPI001F560297|nr:beta-ketoacyl synthase N-terminal-like domain-containing protein [Saccharopolyspora soli]MCI2422330.1 hypothetical protein [Saccharopolyspora soli]
MAAPGLSLVLDAAGVTAPDGRSESFDANADGCGSGECGGVVVLKRLSDARRITTAGWLCCEAARCTRSLGRILMPLALNG